MASEQKSQRRDWVVVVVVAFSSWSGLMISPWETIGGELGIVGKKQGKNRRNLNIREHSWAARIQI